MTESGMLTTTITVLRKLPRNRRIIVAVSSAAIQPSTTSPSMARVTNVDWSESSSTSRPFGAEARMVGSIAFTRLATSVVEAEPVFITLSTTERLPSRRAMLVCTAYPSCTWATSRM